MNIEKCSENEINFQTDRTKRN